MAYQYEKSTADIVVSGWEKGIAVSPHQGTANLKAVNLKTETGEVMCSFNRVQQTQSTVAGSGTFTQVNTNTISVSGLTLLVGTWVTITNSTISGLVNNSIYYYVSTGKLSATFAQDASTIITGLGSGTATFTPIVMGRPIQSATETYGTDTAGTIQYRYYVLDSLGYIWVHDSATLVGVDTPLWFLPNAYQNGLSSTVNYLVVAGGGGGRSGGGALVDGAGGGGGQLKTGSLSVTAQAYTITIGAGGAIATNGNDSSFSTITSTHGNAGGVTTGGTSGSGNAGGTGVANACGGGGGDSTIGSNGSGTTGGNGGTGTANSLSGASVTYGGGGGGGGNVGGTATGGGGNGGGNNGGGTAGTANTGGGGGGGGDNGGLGGVGGSGIVIISFPTNGSTGVSTTSTGGTITTSGGNQIHTFTTSGTFTLVPQQILPAQTIPTNVSGLAVLNGWLSVVKDFSSGPGLAWESTSILGGGFSGSGFSSILNTRSTHVSYVGHQGKMYTTDGNFIASTFPNTALNTGATTPNIQSYCSFTAVTTTVTLTAIIGGSLPGLGAGNTTRVPVTFYSNNTIPTAITADTIYYIARNTNATTYSVYAAASGGAAINMQAGAVGNQYFNTFYPLNNSGSGNATTTVTFTPQRLTLPFYESATAIAEIGNTVIIGGTGNVIYPWNQVSNLPQDLLFLPENNTAKILSVNNTAYIFAGQNANIYITNGSSISPVITVPDYCAGIAGTPSTYIDPTFTWGDAAYCEGKVIFSVLDQSATKAGNCGGIWSFIPTQNAFIQNDQGLALRLENQSSYGSYNGVATVLIAKQIQDGVGTLYWSGWYSSVTSPTYGIDYTDSIPQTAVIETDLIPTGTMLDKKTLSQIEYKLSSPLVAGDSVSIAYRQNSTDAFVSCGTLVTESITGLSGYYPVNFQKGQWLQLQATLTPLGSASSSFIRLSEVRIR